MLGGMRRSVLAMVALGLGCPAPAPKQRPVAIDSATACAAALAPSASAAPLPGPATTIPPGAEACGDLECLAFPTPKAAFEFVLFATKPRVLAVGEAHAPKGSEGVDSSSKRFREQILPLLEKKASDVVIELLLPAANCGDATKKVEAKVIAPVTSAQRPTNKSEFVELGERAKALAIQPWALTPSCDQFKSVASAGEDGVLKMLPLIAQLTRERIELLLSKRGPDALVVAYGGALHNDLHPQEDRQTWSFGPQLAEKTAGRYVELDFIVPEYIRDSDTWRRLPWYSHFDPKRAAGKTTLFRLAAGSYVFIFPSSAP